eukprot:NODE_467_length_7071_cov_0.830752.p1 type:complete len:554 gc:universal NODE_467_length_7071_cov_0.830752:605-2266(+)
MKQNSAQVDSKRGIIESNLLSFSSSGRLDTRNPHVNVQKHDTPMHCEPRIFKVYKSNDLELGAMKDHGSFGFIYKAKLKDRYVAVKKLEHRFEDTGSLDNLDGIVINEINTLKTLRRCPYIVKYIGCTSIEKYFGIITELVDGHSLDYWIHREGQNCEYLDSVLKIQNRVALGLRFMHQKNIYHNDLKPANIMLNGNFSPKIVDLGLAHICNKDKVNSAFLVGTPAYRAPEYWIEGCKFSSLGDIYSFGLIVGEMMTSIKPWKKVCSDAIGKKMSKSEHSINHVFSIPDSDLKGLQFFVDLITECLEIKLKRISIDDLIELYSQKSVDLTVQGYLHELKNEKDKALCFYEQAIRLDNTNAMINSGLIWNSCGDLAKTKQYFEMAAEFGDTDGINWLATLYLIGRGVKSDYNMSLNLFKKTIRVDPDNFYAQCNLGFMYQLGLGVKANNDKAKKYFKQLIKSFEYDSNFAIIQSKGIFNLQKRENCFKQRYRHSKEFHKYLDPPTKPLEYKLFGLMYFFGMGVKKDQYKALSCFLLGDWLDQFENLLKMTQESS